MDKVFDYTLSTKIESPHKSWGKPFIHGKTKVFFVPSIRFGREIVELIQRMDIDYDNVTIDRYWDANKWGFGDFYGKRCGIGDFDLVYKNLESALCSSDEYDVLVLPGINGWGHFTEKTRKAIQKRVQMGTGLVLIQPFHGKDQPPSLELDAMSPLRPLYEEGLNQGGRPAYARDALRNDPWIPFSHYITSGIPFNLFPFQEMGYYPYENHGEIIIQSQSGKPVASVREYGSGRVVAFGYYPRDILPQHIEFHGYDPCYEPIIENWHGARHSLSFNYLEYFYGLINRSIIWAAKKEAQQRIVQVAAESNSLSVQTMNGGECMLHYIVKNEYDTIVAEATQKSDRICLPDWFCMGGRYRTDIYLIQESMVMDWHTSVVEYPPLTRIESIELDRAVYKPEEGLRGNISVKGTMGEIQIHIVDDYDRVIYCESRKITEDTKLFFAWRVEEMKSIHGRIEAVITLQGNVIHRLLSDPFIVSPVTRQLNDFEVFMCPINRGQGDLLMLERERMQEMGITGLFLGDNKLSTLSGADDLFVTWNDRWPYLERKEMYLRTKDKKFLHRLTCLNDPSLWEENEKKIRETVGKNKRFFPISYFANDEGSLTCYTDELDLDFSPHAIAQMQEWLQGEYKSLAELNENWGTAFEYWSDIEPHTYLEVQKTGNFGSWGDHRRFMAKTFADTYAKLRDLIQKVDPEGVVRISGTQKSTPYSGYDYYLLHQYIGYFEAYSVGNQYELHRSFARPETIIGSWVGYGANGMNAANQIWTALLHGVTLLNVFWEYSCLNPDFTFSRSAADMSRTFKEIKREGIGQLLLYSAVRDSLGIGIHYSMNSIHGSYIRKDFTRYEENLQGWIELLQDLGYQYNFVASQQIESGELIKKGYKLFILPYSIALSHEEAEEMKRFVESGGILLGDIQTGIMDQHCKLYENGRLDEVFGIDRYTTDTQPFYIDNEFTACPGFTWFEPVNLYNNPELSLVEYGTREKTGIAAYVQDFSRTVASVIVNEFGQGKGIYLNFSLQKYANLRKVEGGGAKTRDLFKKILTITKVTKFAVIHSDLGALIERGYETIYYSDEEAEYAAIIKDMLSDGVMGYDGLSVGNLESEAVSQAKPLYITFRKKSHVYDVRERQYLGYMDEVSLTMEAGAVKIFAMLPDKLEGIQLNTIGQVKQGEELIVHGSLITNQANNLYRHTLSIQFFNSQNEYAWIYSENITIQGKEFSRSYKMAHNDKKGLWRINIKDAATGVSAKQEFEIVE